MRLRRRLSTMMIGRQLRRAHGLRSLLRTASRLRAYDQRNVAADFYRPTGFFWKQSFDQKTRERCATGARAALAATQAPAEQLALLGVIYRMTGLSDGEQATATAIDPGVAADAPDLQFELLLLLHVVQAWPELASAARHLLADDATGARERALAADMLVHAAYQAVAPRIFRNTIDAAARADFASAISAAKAGVGPGSAKAGHYDGLIASVAGDLDEAARLHAVAEYNIGYATQFLRAATNVIPVADMRALADRAETRLDSTSFDMRHEPSSPCTLIACDQGYFAQFIDAFTESFGLLNPGGMLHIHAIGFRPLDARIAGLEAAHGVRINITHDPMTAAGLTQDLFKGYCAGARYMYLPQYLNHYDRVIVHDVDGILETSMAAVLEGWDADILLSSLMLEPDRKAHFAFWSNIGAGAFAVTSTPAAVDFTRALGAYLMDRFDHCKRTGNRFFFTDQVGLLLATLAFRNTCRFGRMPRIFNQSSDTRNQARGKAKKAAQQEGIAKLRERDG